LILAPTAKSFKALPEKVRMDKTPTPQELRKLCDILCDKACSLSERLDEVSPLIDWQAWGCAAALNELHMKMDRMLEIIASQSKRQTG
jgi:hypothetical protein